METWRRAAQLLAGLWLVASVAPVLAEVVPTMESIFVFDSQGGTTFRGAPVPVGAVIDAYDPEGVHCGTITVGDLGDSTGYFALMSVYRDTPGDPDEGAAYGDTISFTINGLEAEVTRGGPEIWNGNGDMYDISLDVPDLATVLASGQELEAGRPMPLELRPSYPNPFNSTTRITYQLRESADVVVSVHNLVGQRVVTLAEGWRHADTHTLHWDGLDAGGREMAGGTYLCRLQAGAQVVTEKLLLVR